MRKAGSVRLLLLLSITSMNGVALSHVSAVRAQTVLDLPRPSQSASVMQRVGLTDINIHYSRPLVKGRKIWGALVPYDQVWRAGANENTTISFSDPVTIEGQPLAAGAYGLHVIPHEKDWTIIFSRNSTSWGSFTYKPEEDALRVNVKFAPSDFNEALTYEFADPQPNAVTVTLRWERLAVSFHVGVETSQIVARSLEKQLRAWSRWNWQSWDEAAEYLLENHGDLQVALADADHSIQVEERFENLLTKSQILAASQRKDEAITARTKALALASSQQLHNYGLALIAKGRAEEAFEIFKFNIEKRPNTLIAYIELARIASGRGDFAEAIKQINLALPLAPEAAQRNLQNMLRRLQNKEDINK